MGGKKYKLKILKRIRYVAKPLNWTSARSRGPVKANSCLVVAEVSCRAENNRIIFFPTGACYRFLRWLMARIFVPLCFRLLLFFFFCFFCAALVSLSLLPTVCRSCTHTFIELVLLQPIFRKHLAWLVL